MNVRVKLHFVGRCWRHSAVFLCGDIFRERHNNHKVPRELNTSTFMKKLIFNFNCGFCFDTAVLFIFLGVPQ